MLFYQGPSQPRGFKTPPTAGQWAPLYSEFHKATLRQGFIVRARWDVSNTTVTFGPNTQPTNLDTAPASLHWCDIPDPTPGPVFQRKIIEIPEQFSLPKTLVSNDYSFKNETLEETYTYYRDTIEFSLVRYRTFPNLPTNQIGQPQQRFPEPFSTDKYPPKDPTDKWHLFVRAYIPDKDTEGDMKKVHDHMKKAHEELMDIRAELEGVFEFPSWDRKCFDTRIAVHVNNMPAPLPQVQSAREQG